MRRSGCTERFGCFRQPINAFIHSGFHVPVQDCRNGSTASLSSRSICGTSGTYYKLVWGVEKLSVKSTEAGAVIRFTYEVLDPQKANMLNDKRLEPSLIDEQAHVKLIVPTMDKVGKIAANRFPRSGKDTGCCFRTRVVR